MQRDVSGLIAFDFVLRLLFTRVMDIAFVVHVFGVHARDFAADPASFRIPTHVIANFELLGHGECPGIWTNKRSSQNMQTEHCGAADVPKNNAFPESPAIAPAKWRSDVVDIGLPADTKTYYDAFNIAGVSTPPDCRYRQSRGRGCVEATPC
jgi:hypothetical protein